MRTTFAALLLVTGAAAPSLALADPVDGPEAQLAVSMGFGGTGNAHGYAVALAYRGEDAGAPAIRLAEWRVAGDVGVARLAGVPVLARDYKTNQRDDPIAYGSSPLNWAWWVASGALATVLIVNAVDDDDPPVTGTGSGS